MRKKRTKAAAEAFKKEAREYIDKIVERVYEPGQIAPRRVPPPSIGFAPASSATADQKDVLATANAIDVTPYEELMALSDEQISSIYDQLENEPSPRFELAAEESMSPEQFLRIFVKVNHCPIQLADGRLGLVIRGCDLEDRIGVQVPGEPDIRWIPVGTVRHVLNGAFEEKM